MSGSLTIRQIDMLSPFCADDDEKFSRYNISRPYVQDGWLVATDGRVLARLPAGGLAEDDELGKVPRAADVFKPIPDGAIWQPWPEVIACSKCRGERLVRCNECGGSGFLGRFDRERTCDECSEGKVYCDSCCGVGSFGHRFGETILALWMAHLISTLPNVEYLPGEKKGSVRFRFAGGGEGVAMGLNED